MSNLERGGLCLMMELMGIFWSLRRCRVYLHNVILADVWSAILVMMMTVLLKVLHFCCVVRISHIRHWAMVIVMWYVVLVTGWPLMSCRHRRAKYLANQINRKPNYDELSSAKVGRQNLETSKLLTSHCGCDQKESCEQSSTWGCCGLLSTCQRCASGLYHVDLCK